MNIEVLHARARQLKIDYSHVTPKRILIRAIQQQEGGAACFMSDDRYRCTRMDCEWRAECKKLVAAWMR